MTGGVWGLGSVLVGLRIGGMVREVGFLVLLALCSFLGGGGWCLVCGNEEMVVVCWVYVPERLRGMEVGKRGRRKRLSSWMTIVKSSGQ